MKTVLIVVQMVVALLFMLSVLVQSKGSGLSAAIGGQAGAVQSTKRGAEKLVSQASVVLAILFVSLSLVFVFVP